MTSSRQVSNKAKSTACFKAITHLVHLPCMGSHSLTQARAHTHTCAYSHPLTHIHAHPVTHTISHTYTHTHTHTHTHTEPRRCWGGQRGTACPAWGLHGAPGREVGDSAVSVAGGPRLMGDMQMSPGHHGKGPFIFPGALPPSFLGGRGACRREVPGRVRAPRAEERSRGHGPTGWGGVG